MMEEASVEKDQEDCVSWKSSEAVDNSSRGQEDRLSAVTGADKTNQDNCQTDLDVKVTSKRDFDVDSSAVTLSLEDKFIGMETTFNRSQTQLQGHPLCQFSGQTNSNSSQTSAFTRTGQNLVVIEENTDQNIVLVPSSEIHQFQQQDSRTVLSTPETLMVAKQTDSNKETSNAHSSTPDFQTLPSSLSSTHLQSLPSLQMQSSSIFSVPHSVHDQQSQFQHRSVLPPAGERLTITDVKSLSSVSGSSLSPGTVTPPLSTVMSTTSILDTAVAQSLLSTSVSPAPAIQLSPTSMCNSHQLALLKLPLVSGRESINMETALECRWLNCNQLYMKMEDLVNHVNVAHVKVERDVEYKCRWEGCPRNGRGFNARYKMLIHVRTHTNEKPHRCSQCGKSFSRLENLKIHNRSHTGERPYVCPFEGCTKAYSNSSDRFKHVRTHQVDKPYCCKMPGCNKRYTDPSSLRKHIKTRSHFFRGQPLLIKPAQEPANENTAKTESANEMMKPRDQSQSMLQLPQSVSPNQLSSPLNSVFAIAPNGLISPSQVISLHGNVVPISALTSNPLLSSTMITPLVNTHSTSTQTESVVMTTAEAPSSECPNKDSRSGSPMLTADGKVHIQEGPLDLSTSPVNVISTPVDIGQGDGVSLNGVLQPKWDLINSDEVVYR